MINDKYVLDTSALMAFLEDEDGADVVEKLLEQAEYERITIYTSFITFTEIYYISIQEQGKRIAMERMNHLESMPIHRVESNPELTMLAGELKAYNAISIADAFIAALAKDNNAVLVHKDPEFESIEKQLNMLKLAYKN